MAQTPTNMPQSGRRRQKGREVLLLREERERLPVLGFPETAAPFFDAMSVVLGLFKLQGLGGLVADL